MSQVQFKLGTTIPSSGEDGAIYLKRDEQNNRFNLYFGNENSTTKQIDILKLNADFIDNYEVSQLVCKANKTIVDGTPKYISYTNLADYYTGSAHPTFYKITLPSNQIGIWSMITMKLLVRQTYGYENAGTITINAHHNVTDSWDSNFNACIDGSLTGNIKIYASGQDSFYIEGCNTWSSLTIEKVLTGDSITTTNISDIKISVVDSLPEGVIAATMHHGSIAFTQHLEVFNNHINTFNNHINTFNNHINTFNNHINTEGSGNAIGHIRMWKAKECTTYTSDNGTMTLLAVNQAFELYHKNYIKPVYETQTNVTTQFNNAKSYAKTYTDTEVGKRSLIGHTHDTITSGVGGQIALYFDNATDKNHWFKPSITYPKTQEINLGSNKDRTWDNIFYSTSCQKASDIRKKENFSNDMKQYVEMLDLILPTSYLLKSDIEKGIFKRNVGYLAQEVQEALRKVGLSDNDFSGLYFDEQSEKEGFYTYSLDYSQFIPILHAKIKQLEKQYDKKIEELNKKIKLLEKQENEEEYFNVKQLD